MGLEVLKTASLLALVGCQHRGSLQSDRRNSEHTLRRTLSAPLHPALQSHMSHLTTQGLFLHLQEVVKRIPPVTEEWIKMWCVYTVEYYSTIKRNETGSFVEMWTDLELFVQSEASQKEKNKYGVLTHICGSRNMVQMNLSVGLE